MHGPVNETATSTLRQPPRSRRALWLGLGVCAIAWLTMGRMCGYDFTVWDDVYTIYHNPRLNPPTLDTLKYYWTHQEQGLYMPGTYTVWSALAAAGRLEQPDET